MKYLIVLTFHLPLAPLEKDEQILAVYKCVSLRLLFKVIVILSDVCWEERSREGMRITD